MALDLLIFQFLYETAARFSFFNFLFVSFAVYLPWFLGFFALWLIFEEKKLRIKIYDLFFTMLVVLVSRGIITELLRFFIERGRPYEILGIKPLFLAIGSSFPSGHAALLFALAFAIWHVRQGWASWFFVAAFAVSLARVMSGVHWPSDVIGGFLVAFVSYFAVKQLIPRRTHAEADERVV